MYVWFVCLSVGSFYEKVVNIIGAYSKGVSGWPAGSPKRDPRKEALGGFREPLEASGVFWGPLGAAGGTTATHVP